MTDIKEWKGWDRARRGAVEGARGRGSEGARTREETDLDRWLAEATRTACAIREDAVVASGDTKRPRMVIVGKAPAEEEVRQGRTFVGASGGEKGLGRLLRATGMSLRFGGGAIATNAGFWLARPGQDPSSTECAYSAPIVAELIEKVGPKVILALGAKAAETLTSITGPVARLRGRWHKCTLTENEGEVRVTYHPAYLMREPQAWPRAEADMEAVARYLEE